jgi:hypothetical protein
VKFNIPADSFRGIFWYAFSRQAPISLCIVSQRMSKKFELLAGKLALARKM